MTVLNNDLYLSSCSILLIAICCYKLVCTVVYEPSRVIVMHIISWLKCLLFTIAHNILSVIITESKVLL